MQITKDRKIFWIYFSVFASSVIGGGGFVFMKDSLAVFPVPWFTFWRFFVSAAVLFPFLAKKANSWAILRDGFIVGAIFCAATLIQLAGVAGTGAGKSAFINSSSIVLVPVLEALLVRRAPSLKTAAGCVLCLCGVALLSAHKITGDSGGAAELLVFAGTALFACHFVALRMVVQRHDPIVLSFVEFAAIAILALPAAYFYQAPLWPFEGGAGWGGVLYTALMLNILMLMAFNNAMRYVSATDVSVIGSTQAIYGAFFGALILSEPLTWQFVLSGAAVIAGVLLVITASRQKNY